MKAYSGRFTPKNPQKYKGDPTKIIYRSSWELRVMGYLDNNPNIIQWASEELAIPYKSPIDGKWHRYFPDFVVKMRDRDGKVTVKMLEVKPKAQSVPPTIKKGSSKPSKKYLKEVMTWGINSSKWEAAKEYCADRNWQFVVLTEKELGL
jgi:hypothetical protein